MLRITDKAFRYTPSHETDLAKKFRNMERDRRGVAAKTATAPGAPLTGAFVAPMGSRRCVQNG